MDKINLLMATHNGEKYLSNQIESLLEQTYINWKLLIRDDGSKDNTLKIINKYKKKDNRIKLISDTKGNLGVAKNFEELIKKSNSNYIIFVDQDDVWKKNKIETLYSNIKKLEQKHSPKTPILVHSDSYITDENLNIISKKFIGKRGNLNGLNNLIFSPSVQGSSMIINNSLKNKILPFPDAIKVHDYYISIVNEIFGVRKFINKPLMYYRQHSNNEIGFDKNIFTKLGKILKRDFIIANLNQIITIDFIYKNFYEEMNKKDKIIMEKFKYIIDNDNNKFMKIYYIIKYGFKNNDGMLSLIIKVLMNG